MPIFQGARVSVDVGSRSWSIHLNAIKLAAGRGRSGQAHAPVSG